MMRAAAVVLHVAAGALGADDHAEEVHVHDAGEVLEVVGQEPLERAPDAGVVEHDVQAAEAVDREVHQGLHLLGVAHVRLLEGGGLADLRGHFLAALFIDIRDHDPGPLGRKQSRRSPDRCHLRRRSRSPPCRRAPVSSCHDHSALARRTLQPRHDTTRTARLRHGNAETVSQERRAAAPPVMLSTNPWSSSPGAL